MAAITTIARGLRFPEGPIAMPDGSVVLVEIERQTLSRVRPNGEVSVVATLGGGPNGAALGPDGRCYICNNGGFEWHRRGDTVVLGLQGSDYQGAAFRRSTWRQVRLRRCIRTRIKGPCVGQTTSYLMRTRGFGLQTLARLGAMTWTGALYATPGRMAVSAAKSFAPW